MSFPRLSLPLLRRHFLLCVRSALPVSLPPLFLPSSRNNKLKGPSRPEQYTSARHSHSHNSALAYYFSTGTTELPENTMFVSVSTPLKFDRSFPTVLGLLSSRMPFHQRRLYSCSSIWRCRGLKPFFFFMRSVILRQEGARRGTAGLRGSPPIDFGGLPWC